MSLSDLFDDEELWFYVKANSITFWANYVMLWVLAVVLGLTAAFLMWIYQGVTGCMRSRSLCGKKGGYERVESGSNERSYILKEDPAVVEMDAAPSDSTPPK
jgi:hypothetical protein